MKPALLGLSALLACFLLAGCYLPATAETRADILKSLKAYEAGKDRRSDIDHRANIEVLDCKAVAEYPVDIPGRQQIGIPLRVELAKQDDGWQVTSEKENWSWWQQFASHFDRKAGWPF
jgi:hypothetical protein